jgi:N-acetylglutamate synthase-like GNAT family acetyltransferase
MKIRTANKFDFPEIVAMLHRFKMQGPTKISNDFNNEDHVALIYAHIMAGAGVALVAEKEGKLAGMLIGVIDGLIWNPDTRILREIVYWVDEEYRGSTAGYRLLAQYVKECNEMVNSGRITAYSMVKMTNSPDLKFEKFGFTKTEEVYVAGLI